MARMMGSRNSDSADIQLESQKFGLHLPCSISFSRSKAPGLFVL